VMLDPENKLVDPNADWIEHYPKEAPRAKPVVWECEQNGRTYGKDYLRRTKYEFGPTIGSDKPVIHAYSRDENWHFSGENDDEAKAACEAHHQARFLEQCA
jgi:hypothetical protein